MDIGVSTERRTLDINFIASQLGTDCCKGHLALHPFSGNNYTSAFYGIVEANLNIPKPNEYGWREIGNQLEVKLMHIRPAPEDVLQLIPIRVKSQNVKHGLIAWIGLYATVQMERHKFYDPELMSQDDVFNLLDSIDAGELDTFIEDNFLSDDNPDFVHKAHHFNMENILDNDADETNEMKNYRRFLEDKLYQEIVNTTNLYARQMNISTKFVATPAEIQKCVGILFYMSIYRYPNTREYCGENSFEPSVPMSQRLCVDEQMCSTKMVSHIRQYMPSKPHKWGMKLFVLCDTYGFSYGFELYSGASDNKIPNGAPDLGAAVNAVSRLSQIIPDHMNHIVYFDNYYSTLPLMIYLVLLWSRLVDYTGKDNKGVRLASTYVGVLPFKNESNNTLKTSRYDRAQKKRIEIDCPNIIREYNAHMGGVDLMDGLLGRYHIRMKTVKWTSRFFYHKLDLAMINAYLLHKRINRQNKACNIQLPQFRKEVAVMLCRFQTDEPQKRSVGRPRSTNAEEDPAPKRLGKRTY
nr:piggyBac transposable element-derived protein 1-like [Hydra vulgaris]